MILRERRAASLAAFVAAFSWAFPSEMTQLTGTRYRCALGAARLRSRTPLLSNK
jgi:hypothetical protein